MAKLEQINRGGCIIRNEGHHLPQINEEGLDELGMRQLFDEESNSFSYLIWDKATEQGVLVDPVSNQTSRDVMVSTNLHLLYAINTHVHEDHISGSSSLKKKIKGLKSVISRESGADADEYIEDGDEIHFGNRHIVALATPGHTSGCMSFVLDDGKVVENGTHDELLALGGMYHKLYTLQHGGGRDDALSL